MPTVDAPPPAPGIRSQGTGILVGSWSSDTGFPWDVAFVRWSSGALNVGDRPCLVLQPRPYPAVRLRQLQERYEAHRAWQRGPQKGDAAPPAWADDLVREGYLTTPWDDTWPSTGVVLKNTREAVQDLGRSIKEALENGGQAKAERLVAEAMQHTPWLAVVSPDLHAFVRESLGLPQHLLTGDLLSVLLALSSPMKAKSRRRSWPSPGRGGLGRGATLPGALHTAYEALMSVYAGPPHHESTFIVNFLASTGPDVFVANTSDDAKRASAARGWLDKHRTWTVAVPLPTSVVLVDEGQGERHPGSSSDTQTPPKDPSLAAWLGGPDGVRWLNLVFGRQAARLTPIDPRSPQRHQRTGQPVVNLIADSDTKVRLRPLPYGYEQTGGYLGWFLEGEGAAE